MPEVVDLSQFKNKPAAEPTLDALTPEQQEQLAALAEETGTEPELHPVTTAFVVIIETNGAVVATADLDAVERIRLQRQPSADDIYGACSSVQKSITAQETAGFTQQAMLAMSQAVARQQQEQQLLAQVGPNLRG